MLLADNFIHADMHPGNILLRERRGEPPTLVLIDAGMVVRAPRPPPPSSY
jgi:predicted unusual protein kinase regulating ubiquinone biosynthesis (AarF/ABC1/UbiB family)